MAGTVFSQEETLALITAKAKLNNNFTVKVFRKRHQGSLPESVAILEEAQAEHIVTPELWLPRLAGGGPLFLLQVFHADDPAAAVGGYLHVSVPTETLTPKSANEIDINQVRMGTWAGPKRLVYPSKDDRRSLEGPSFSIPGLPPVPSSGNSAANNVPGGGQPGALQRDYTFERNNAVLQEMQAQQAKMDRAREEFAEEQRRQREELAEARRRADLESLRAQSELRMKELEMRMANSAQQAPRINIAEMLTAIGSVLVPLLSRLSESAAESRKLAAEQNRTLMSAIVTRPAVDPMVERLFGDLKSTIERMTSQQTAPSTMIHSMADAMSAMTSTTMELVQTAADLNLGGGRQEDHPALKAIREAVKGITAMFQGYQASIPRPPVPPPRQALPLPPPGYAIAPPPVVQLPAQNAAPAAPVAQAAPAQPPPPKDMLEYLEQLFKAKAPVAQVAHVFIQSINDPVVSRALDEVDGQVEELFSIRLKDFILANPDYVPYMRELHEELNRQGEAAGVFDPEPEDEEEEEEREAANA